MRGRSPGSVQGRAITGVIALYALLLQAFLGFAAPVAALDPAGAVLCAEHPGGAPTDDGTGKAQAQCHACCTAAHPGAVAPPPSATAAAHWPRPAYAHVAWRPEAEIPRTGPPVHAASARGPPAA